MSGGGVFDIDDPASVPELMSEVVEETAAVPTASLKVLPSVTGQPTVVSAVDSTYDTQVATFDFDLDGDGAYEVSDGDPVQSLDLTAGRHDFGVRVTDSEGRSATATATVTTYHAATTFLPLVPATPSLSGLKVSKRIIPGKTATVTVPNGSVPADAAVVVGLVPQGSPVINQGGSRLGVERRRPRGLPAGRAQDAQAGLLPGRRPDEQRRIRHEGGPGAPDLQAEGQDQ